MGAFNMTSVSLRGNAWEKMERGKNINSPRSCMITPEGSCPMTSSPLIASQETDSRVPLESDRSRGFRSEPLDKGSFRAPQVGDRCTRWNYEFEWSEGHKTPTQLEPLRHAGDPLADDCVAALNIKPGTDSLEILAQYLSRPACEQESEAPRTFYEDALRAPDWVNWSSIMQAQETFWAYVAPILFVLFHYSLAGGFASPGVVRTLQCTNYLASPGRTMHRLLETVQFVVDCMKGGIETLQPGTGTGWASILRVRLLHTQVRLRILKLAASHPNYYSVEQYGVPINQEDSVATLCAFSISVIVSLEKMGVHLSSEEVSAYLHLWRLVGHYMGVLPENNPLTSREDALVSFESVFSHLLNPDETCAAMTSAILRAVAERPPFRQSFAFHSAMARALLGDELSDALRIERSNWYYRTMVSLLFAMFRWISSPWCFLHYRTRMAQKFLESIVGTGTELNFSMKMVPQVSANNDD